MKEFGRNSLCGYLWRQWKQFRFEHYTLSQTTTHSLEGVCLSLQGLSPRLKRAIIDGTYEQAEVEIAKQLVGEGDQILELGGAIGFVGLFCLTALRAGRVVSVEPNPSTAAQLRKNYELNLRVPELFEAAVSTNDGTMELNVGEDFWEDSFTHRPEHLRQLRRTRFFAALATSHLKGGF